MSTLASNATVQAAMANVVAQSLQPRDPTTEAIVTGIVDERKFNAIERARELRKKFMEDKAEMKKLLGNAFSETHPDIVPLSKSITNMSEKIERLSK